MLTLGIKKLGVSAINAVASLVLSIPILLLEGPGLAWKVATISAFFLLGVVAILFFDNRSVGMIIFGQHCKRRYPLSRQLLYRTLYTMSFSTLFFSFWFPFDVFFINIFLVQLPTLIATGVTFHAWLGGKME